MPAWIANGILLGSAWAAVIAFVLIMGLGGMSAASAIARFGGAVVRTLVGA